MDRKADVVVLDPIQNRCYEVLVNLTHKRVDSFVHVPGAHPALTPTEYHECAQAVRESPEVLEALKRRGGLVLVVLRAKWLLWRTS